MEQASNLRWIVFLDESSLDELKRAARLADTTAAQYYDAILASLDLNLWFVNDELDRRRSSCARFRIRLGRISLDLFEFVLVLVLVDATTIARGSMTLGDKYHGNNHCHEDDKDENETDGTKDRPENDCKSVVALLLMASASASAYTSSSVGGAGILDRARRGLFANKPMLAARRS
eukprot:GEZU01025256.1.p2 GENE.GEZU01025256.1~~GEZU01025256.1.p2  ORF type:complete len:176 (-),score=42.48 GEZU01025256.1:87-614(-)